MFTILTSTDTAFVYEFNDGGYMFTYEVQGASFSYDGVGNLVGGTVSSVSLSYPDDFISPEIFTSTISGLTLEVDEIATAIGRVDWYQPQYFVGEFFSPFVAFTDFVEGITATYSHYGEQVGTTGNDAITFIGNAYRIYANDGDDTILGGSLDDSLYGEAGNDSLLGNNGDDSIEGAAGADFIDGGRGDDTMLGGDENDTIFGNAGLDSIEGGNGDDFIKSGKDSDQVSGGEGDDTLFLGSGDDNADGGAGNDRILGGSGRDFVNGGDGDDKIFLHNGDDVATGGDGNDTMNGGNGIDYLIGGDGDDKIRGGNGIDFLAVGDDNDTVWGGADADFFAFRGDTGTGSADIRDFAAAEDMIMIEFNLATTQAQQFDAFTEGAVQSGSNVIYTNETGGVIVTFRNTDLTDITIDNFQDVAGSALMYGG